MTTSNTCRCSREQPSRCYSTRDTTTGPGVVARSIDGPLRLFLRHVNGGHSEHEGWSVPTWNACRGGHAELSPREAADGLAIRELVDAYAYCADRRDASGQMSLFTDDEDFLVYMDSRNPLLTLQFRGRDALAPVFSDLNVYEATMHFNGQSTTVFDGDHASGVTYCLAHRVKVEGPERSLMIASIRYLAAFVKHDGRGFSANANSWSIGPKSARLRPVEAVLVLSAGAQRHRNGRDVVRSHIGSAGFPINNRVTEIRNQ